MLRNDWIKGPIMAQRSHKCYHWALQKGRPDGQCRKIQYHGLQARGGLHRDVRGGFQLDENRRVVHVSGSPAVEHPMSRL